MNPKISICIPTFNRSDLLEKALKSVSVQTVKPFEVIVVDNASTDDTKEVVARYKKWGVKYFCNRKNVGMANNWNVCIKKSKGDFLTFLHNDDVISPEWYQVMCKAVQDHPKVKFFTSSLLVIDADERVLHCYHTFSSSQLIPKEQAMRAFYTHLLPGLAPLASNLYHKSIFTKIGGYDANMQTEADFEHSIKILKNYDVYYIHEPIFAYRVHAKQGFDLQEQQKTFERELDRKANHYAIVKRWYKKWYKNNNNMRFFIQYPVLMTLAPMSLFVLKGDWNKVLKHFHLVKQYFPDFFTHWSDIWLYCVIVFIFIKRLTYDKLLLLLNAKQFRWLMNES